MTGRCLKTVSARLHIRFSLNKSVTAAALGVTALADPITDTYSCRTYVYERRQYSRELAVETKYKKGTVDIITAGIECLRIDTGAKVGTGEPVSSKNGSSGVNYEKKLL